MARFLALLLAFSPLTAAATPSAVAPASAPESQDQLDHLFDGRASSSAIAAGHGPAPLSAADMKFLNDLLRRNFRYFQEQTDAKTGLTADRASADGAAPHQLGTTGVASVASTGFGLSALCVAAGRGDVPRQEAVARAKATLTFLKDKAPQEHGFFYHFIGMSTGAREWKSEVSSIDTALLMAGVLTAKQCFADPEISALADALYARIDFPWMLNGSKNLLSMGWTPEKGFLPARWDTYSEHMILDLLAIGSPTHPIPAAEWDAWARPVVDAGGQTYVAGTSPLFIHQYSQAYVDFRGKCDAHGLNYFDNSVKATLAQRRYMKDNGKAYGWSENVWGLTASDTCTGGYAAWGAPPPEGPIDGTVVPSAPGGSLMFTPRESLAALQEMRARYPKIYGRYGFTDSFTPKTGCVNKDVLGIDQGITLLSAANLENGAVWDAFMKNPEITGAMAKVGFGACR
ncbi:MAG: glucoamylase family protein [Elusimicrobiota bacterium]